MVKRQTQRERDERDKSVIFSSRFLLQLVGWPDEIIVHESFSPTVFAFEYLHFIEVQTIRILMDANLAHLRALRDKKHLASTLFLQSPHHHYEGVPSTIRYSLFLLGRQVLDNPRHQRAIRRPRQCTVIGSASMLALALV